MPRDLLWGKYKLGPERKRRHEDKGERKKFKKGNELHHLLLSQSLILIQGKSIFLFRGRLWKLLIQLCSNGVNGISEKNLILNFKKKVFMVTAAESRGTDFWGRFCKKSPDQLNPSGLDSRIYNRWKIIGLFCKPKCVKLETGQVLPPTSPICSQSLMEAISLELLASKNVKIAGPWMDTFMQTNEPLGKTY